MAPPRSGLALLPRAETITQEGFGAFVASRDKVILKIGLGSQPSFLNDVLRYFAAEHRDAIRFGYLDRSRVVAFPSWGMKHLGRIFESQATVPAEAPDGYYLFARRQPIAFHPGTRTDHQHDLAVMGAGALVALIAWSPTPLSASLDVLNRKAAEGVIAFFEEVMAKIPPPVDWTAFAAASKARVKHIDPYAVLGVPPTASDAEVKTAYREQQRLNHPDLVARMSPEIQKVAHERTQAINEAYRTIIMEPRRKK